MQRKGMSGKARKPQRRRPIVRVLGISSAPSPRVLRAMAPFGLAVSRRERGARTQPRVREIVRVCRGPCVVAITGSSGGGKSTMLRALAKALRRRRTHRVVVVSSMVRRDVRRALVDVIPGSLGRALGVLARCGLADATLLPRAIAELSEGQRARAAIAVGLARGADVLLIDEFASMLDRVTARALSLSLAAHVRRTRGVLIVATAHSDVLAWLRPDVIVRCEQMQVSVEGGGDERSGRNANCK
jgi:ABC-type ATPase with predicted acetyltransferase domain